MEPELIKILIAMAVQTVMLAQVNKVRIESLKDRFESVDDAVNDAKGAAVRAHHRIDNLLEGKAKCH